jgi:putative nucleotidyltransferase with HDIG domain
MSLQTKPIHVWDADSLTPLPAVALRVVEECHVKCPDTARLIELVECEPAIASKVLSIANSPLYGCARQIDTIPRAILVLGARSISGLAVAVSTKAVFEAGESTATKKSLMEHSLGTAVVARTLASQDFACDPSSAFLAGMMHDIGKLVFLEHAQDQYESNLTELRLSSVENEEALFGINHVSVEKRYVSNMGLPREISDAVSGHHANCPTPIDLTGIASIADQLSKVWGLGTENAKIESKEYESRCEFNCADFADLKDTAKESYESIKCVFQQ